MLKRAVKRNFERFPEDFMFQLTRVEFENLRFHFGTISWGGQRYMPYAFTENCVATFSSVLNSKGAIHVNIQIMRTFTKRREMLLTHKELQRKIELMEKKYDHQFKIIFDDIRGLMAPPVKPLRKIGFKGKDGLIDRKY